MGADGGGYTRPITMALSLARFSRRLESLPKHGDTDSARALLAQMNPYQTEAQHSRHLRVSTSQQFRKFIFATYRPINA